MHQYSFILCQTKPHLFEPCPLKYRCVPGRRGAATGGLAVAIIITSTKMATILLMVVFSSLQPQLASHLSAANTPALSKTSRVKKWRSNFIADKLAILLVLCQQVMDEMEEWKQSSSVGNYAQAIIKLRRTFATLHQKYIACEQRYTEDQRIGLNRHEHMPSLSYQTKGGRLQDGILWDPAK